MSLVLDAGALIAIERGDRDVVAILHLAYRGESGLKTSGGVVAQVWRDGARQASLARLLANTLVAPLDAGAGRRVGELLRNSGTSDVVDGHVAVITATGDTVLTSDPTDIADLLDARGADATIREV